MIKRASVLAILGLAVVACGGAEETAPAAEAADEAASAEDTANAAGADAPTDYSELSNWLCHPGKAEDACDIDLDYTVVSADGMTEQRAYTPANDPAIDCFYIYPTVSMDETPNSDLTPGDEELRVVESQFAHFGSACRLYAPMYRQMTIPELRSRMMGGEVRADEDMRWADVSGAWQAYVETQNDGRGVVIIGHSQGAHMIEELVSREIEGAEIEGRVLSVMPIGWTAYPDASSGGIGPFAPCETLGQTGCSVSYVSFRATSAPPERSWFGQTNDEGRRALCVNPAAVTGSGDALDARLSARNWVTGEAAGFMDEGSIETPFASVPGLLTGACVETEEHTYLEVTVNGDPTDPRTDDIAGDVMIAGQVLSDWGLHLVDMNVAMGDLVTIVEAQANSWSSSEELAE
ncbi:DUF3089 domain-containing protein [Henriciella marina]|uniref:DUF3089 domain-containing protein n=1 Tax=Henriciella marina TaxID=453851 RepID=UPI0003635D5E|nr:DUF3089 domain-containing protein [Henriciella marina]